jgi:hypothetical protein
MVNVGYNMKFENKNLKALQNFLNEDASKQTVFSEAPTPLTEEEKQQIRESNIPFRRKKRKQSFEFLYGLVYAVINPQYFFYQKTKLEIDNIKIWYYANENKDEDEEIVELD